MKKFLVVLSILAAISLPSLASGLADKPTVAVNLENYTLGAGGSSVTMTYFLADAEIPAATGNFLVNFRIGNNLGLSETTYKVGYRFELK